MLLLWPLADAATRAAQSSARASAFAAAAAAGTLVVYVVIALLAWRQVREAQKLREEQARPWVVVDIVPAVGSPVLILVIENLGKTVARDVGITFSPVLQPLPGGEDLFEAPALRDGIAFLPPRRQLRFELGYWSGDDSAFDRRHLVSIACSDAQGVRLPDSSYDLDFSALRGSILPWDGARQVARAVERIASSLESEARAHRESAFPQHWSNQPVPDTEDQAVADQPAKRSRLRQAIGRIVALAR